jgi:hypothetical protein
MRRQPRSPETEQPSCCEAVKESKIAGETACATPATAVFPEVGQAVSPADFLPGAFLYSFLSLRVPWFHDPT